MALKRDKYLEESSSDPDYYLDENDKLTKKKAKKEEEDFLGGKTAALSKKYPDIETIGKFNEFLVSNDCQNFVSTTIKHLTKTLVYNKWKMMPLQSVKAGLVTDKRRYFVFNYQYDDGTQILSMIVDSLTTRGILKVTFNVYLKGITIHDISLAQDEMLYLEYIITKFARNDLD